MVKGVEKVGDIYISDTQISLNDDPYMIEGQKEIHIPEIHSMKTVTKPQTGASLLRYKLKLHSQQNQISREAYQVMHFLGDIGGFLSILNLFGIIIAHKLSFFDFKSQIFQNIYLERRKPKKEELNHEDDS